MIPAWLTSTRWLLLDVETTGLDPKTDRVLQLAAIQIDDGAIADSLVSLVNPGIDIPPASTAIHGITNEQAQAAPSFSELVPRLYEVSAGRTVLGYNVGFDLEMVRAELERAGMRTKRGGQHADPLVWIKEIDRWEKGPGRHRLETTCARWGVNLPKAHDAQSDALATWDLWRAIVEREHRRFPEDLQDMLQQQARMKREQDADFEAWKARNPKKESAA